jgi:ATP-dependent DNA helicase RecQ
VKVVVVAKINRDEGLQVVGLSFNGRFLPLTNPSAHAYTIGDVWETQDGAAMRKLPPIDNMEAFIRYQKPPVTDGLDKLVANDDPVQFWYCDQPLVQADDTHLHYVTKGGRRIVPFVGEQPIMDEVPVGTLVAVSFSTGQPVQVVGIYFPPAPVDWMPDDGTAQQALLLPPTELPPDPARPKRPLTLTAARDVLKEIFGFDDFRPLQANIIQNVLQKKDSLAIMPTGSGKSLCYQLPALLFSGLTVVVSPLISLMQDQVEQLRALGITAVFLNSTLTPDEVVFTTQQIRSGRARLLYAAPETLVRPDTLQLLSEVQVDCFTIDEAHCISEWGHEFRPEYRQLLPVRERLPHAVCLSVTATATERVRQDIKTSLGIADADEFIASFDRENLFLEITQREDGLSQAIAFLQQHQDESGIIYCTTRRDVDTLSAQLTSMGWRVLPYHAGLDDHTRRRNQRQFIVDDVPIMVATIAFGMGINKPNVRFVLHYNLPKNPESYYQQIGRAGRDGLRADCLLLYSYADVQTINYFIQQQEPSQQVGARMRLEAMLGLVETAVCRRRPLLNYFNEPYAIDNCDFCDNCTKEDEELVDITIPAQKFLSCVKRTHEIFGVTHIIDVLRGSQSQKVVSRGHDKLSTYNIGTEFSKKEWQFLARQFMQQELMVQDMDHGSLKLTEKAYAVFKGQPVMGLLPEQPKSSSATAVLPPHDVGLFNLLRAKRKAVADDNEVPPYIIFSDRTLVEMAIYFPQSRQSFGMMYGVGQAKLDNYATLFLPIVQDYCAEHGLSEKLKTAVSIPRPPSGTGGRMMEVVKLFENGRSVPEIMALFDVKQSTVINHLWKALQAGHTIHADGLADLSQLSPDVQQQVIVTFAKLGAEMLRPVFDAMQGQVNYDELHLLRLVTFAQTQTIKNNLGK